jgi:hypothetical protein
MAHSMLVEIIVGFFGGTPGLSFFVRAAHIIGVKSTLTWLQSFLGPETKQQNQFQKTI